MKSCFLLGDTIHNGKGDRHDKDEDTEPIAKEDSQTDKRHQEPRIGRVADVPVKSGLNEGMITMNGNIDSE